MNQCEYMLYISTRVKKDTKILLVPNDDQQFGSSSENFSLMMKYSMSNTDIFYEGNKYQVDNLLVVRYDVDDAHPCEQTIESLRQYSQNNQNVVVVNVEGNCLEVYNKLMKSTNDTAIFNSVVIVEELNGSLHF